jgi:predicted double-glycine peptidase
MLAASVCLFLSPWTSAQCATLSLKEIREEGVVIQKWDTSCGAAAIATVLTYHFDDPVTEREVASGLLRQTEPLIVRRRGGFSMLDMKRYVENRGYLAIGFQGLGFEDLRDFEAPIVPIDFHGYNHYVILKGLTPAGEVHIADPAYGNLTMPRRSFEKMWLKGMAFVLLADEK